MCPAMRRWQYSQSPTLLATLPHRKETRALDSEHGESNGSAFVDLALWKQGDSVF